jgi:hypothetical protein
MLLQYFAGYRPSAGGYGASMWFLLASTWAVAVLLAVGIGVEWAAADAGYRSVYYAAYTLRVIGFIYIATAMYQLASIGGFKWFLGTPWLPLLLVFASDGFDIFRPAMGFL